MLISSLVSSKKFSIEPFESKKYLSADDGAVKLSKDGIEVGSEQDRVILKQDKANITVDIKGVKKDDAGFYELITNGGKSFGELIVTPKPPVFNAAFTGKFPHRWTQTNG